MNVKTTSLRRPEPDVYKKSFVRTFLVHVPTGIAKFRQFYEQPEDIIKIV